MAAPYPINVWHDTVGETIRVLLHPYSAMETVLNDTTDTFVTYVPASINSYGFALSPIGAGSLLHVGNVPSWVASGVYLFRAFVETGGVITEASRLIEEGPVRWSGSVFSPVELVGATMTYSVTGNESETQFLAYWEGAGFPIDIVADPPMAVDITYILLRIGTPSDYTEFLPGAGRLEAVDASIGHFRAYPTLAESAGWPQDGCLIMPWRTGPGVANTGPMGKGLLEIRETLR